MKSGLKIGVLAVQGAFIEHKRMLESLGLRVCRAAPKIRYL